MAQWLTAFAAFAEDYVQFSGRTYGLTTTCYLQFKVPVLYSLLLILKNSIGE